MTSPTNDLVVLTPTFGPITPSDELLDSVAAFVAKRLEISAIAIPSLEPDALQKLNRLDASVSQPETSVVRRVVLIPCGFAPLKLSDLRTARWFSGLSSSSKCYLADPWTPKEVGEWIGREVMRPKSSRGPNGEIILPLDRSMSLEEVERWALIAFWGNRGCDSTKPRIVLEEPSNETKQSTSSKPPPWLWKCDPESFDAEDLSTWCIQRTLSALRTREIPLDPKFDAEWPSLDELKRRLDSQLPKEISERLDSVSPRSMGSVRIAPDESGRIPWDRIWTSFCDLAMAGGPPHRGKLLEPVPIDEIERHPEAYASVVQEMRRGIGLASGLQTVESPYAGWVAVQCDTEEMAAWLLRAILVENISVRREGTYLFLPAGPHFRIDKEIKNVITSVAKTTHYWKAHLRSRQPPKPL